MASIVHIANGALLALAAAATALAQAEAPAPARAEPAASKVIADIDLSRPFGSNWRLVATQGPDVADPSFLDQPVPGEIHLCLRRSAGAPCAPGLREMPAPPKGVLDLFWNARYLNAAKLVYPRGESASPLLLLQTASAHSGDGDQAVFTQLFAYRKAARRFDQVYGHLTGRNNNEEVRYVASGPLAGSVISAEPMDKPPFGYWITVNELTPAYRYRQALRYPSATRYSDGNPLAVIDSEMPNIEQRLGLWRPGQPLPLPARCPKPRLRHMELWCS